LRQPGAPARLRGLQKHGSLHHQLLPGHANDYPGCQIGDITCVLAVIRRRQRKARKPYRAVNPALRPMTRKDEPLNAWQWPHVHACTCVPFVLSRRWSLLVGTISGVCHTGRECQRASFCGGLRRKCGGTGVQNAERRRRTSATPSKLEPPNLARGSSPDWDCCWRLVGAAGVAQPITIWARLFWHSLG